MVCFASQPARKTCNGNPRRRSSPAGNRHPKKARAAPEARRNRPMKRSGVADLPLHGGRVPPWLADRMSKLGAAIVEAILQSYGRPEFLSRLSDPFWFQALGSVMGMDWHSSGITTSVLGALKRGLSNRSDELGLWICGGRGEQSRRTPDELRRIADRTSADGEALSLALRRCARFYRRPAHGHRR